MPIARALFENAFQSTHDSFGCLLERPNLEEVDYIKLYWKEEVLDKRIILIE